MVLNTVFVEIMVGALRHGEVVLSVYMLPSMDSKFRTQNGKIGKLGIYFFVEIVSGTLLYGEVIFSCYVLSSVDSKEKSCGEISLNFYVLSSVESKIEHKMAKSK